MMRRLRAAGQGVRRGSSRRFGRRRLRLRWSWRSLLLYYAGVTLLVAAVVVAVQRPAWFRGGLETLTQAAADGVARVIPAMQQALGIGAQGNVELVERALPRWHGGGHEPPPAATWSMLFRTWIYLITSYDVVQPISYLEAELPGYARVARTGRQIIRIPSSDGEAEAVPPEGDAPDAGETGAGGASAGSGQAVGPETGESGLPGGDVIDSVDSLDPFARLREADWGSEPLVALLHVHPSEMYRTDTFAPARAGDYYRFDSTDTGVIRVGERVAEILWTEFGIPVVHNQTLHDIPNFTSAYVRGRETVEELLETYPSLLFLFDIHRDGVVDESLLATVGGEHVAQVAVVIGQNHPGWQANRAKADRFGEILQSLYPGVFRRVIFVPRQTYNQDLHPNFLLLEVGNYFDHEQYALRTARLIAEVIAIMLYEEKFGVSFWEV